MKRILATLAAMAFLVPALAQNNTEMKTLVAYFSATGTTEGVAKKLAKVTGPTSMRSSRKSPIARRTSTGATGNPAAASR